MPSSDVENRNTPSMDNGFNGVELASPKVARVWTLCLRLLRGEVVVLVDGSTAGPYRRAVDPPCWALLGKRGELLEVGSPVEVALMVERRGLEVER